jgi:hypothetical protein
MEASTGSINSEIRDIGRSRNCPRDYQRRYTKRRCCQKLKSQKYKKLKISPVVRNLHLKTILILNNVTGTGQMEGLKEKDIENFITSESQDSSKTNKSVPSQQKRSYVESAAKIK